ncbi:hypothetical protein [Chitinophaga sp. S165]|nr:hypothetical protein [Chitinophaga sp. S165]PWV54282.1 hypothetical protein C7475_1021039 [Chitinophaga sp. S165]
MKNQLIASATGQPAVGGIIVLWGLVRNKRATVLKTGMHRQLTVH